MFIIQFHFTVIKRWWLSHFLYFYGPLIFPLCPNMWLLLWMLCMCLKRSILYDQSMAFTVFCRSIWWCFLMFYVLKYSILSAIRNATSAFLTVSQTAKLLSLLYFTTLKNHCFRYIPYYTAQNWFFAFWANLKKYFSIRCVRPFTFLDVTNTFDSTGGPIAMFYLFIWCFRNISLILKKVFFKSGYIFICIYSALVYLICPF